MAGLDRTAPSGGAHLGYISAISRPHLGRISARTSPPSASASAFLACVRVTMSPPVSECLYSRFNLIGSFCGH